MDDVMYGRKPPPAALPDWMRLEPVERQKGQQE
jgi:hypothetical protein